MAYWRLHYHLTWATYQREPFLTEALTRQVYGTILNKAKELGIIVHAMGSVDDHIHVVASIPPKLAVAECVKQFKGASSHWLNHQPGATGGFGWQDGYGAVTFGERSMADVVSYVRNQREHHTQTTTRAIFESIAEQDDGVHVGTGMQV